VRVKNIGLVNIVAGKQIVPELLQWKVKPQRLALEVSTMLKDENLRGEISKNLSGVKEKLGTVGASARVAETVFSLVG
jgi:lipid-A-disaccharide synthase